MQRTENSSANDKSYSNSFCYYMKELVQPISDSTNEHTFFDSGKNFRKYGLGNNISIYYAVPSSDEGSSEDKQIIITDEPQIFYEDGELMNPGINGNRIVVYDSKSGKDISFYRRGVKEPIARFFSEPEIEQDTEKDDELVYPDWIDVHQDGVPKDSYVGPLGYKLFSDRLIQAYNNGCNEDNLMKFMNFYSAVIGLARTSKELNDNNHDAPDFE